MTHRETAERFLTQRIALVGVSRTANDFSRGVLRALLRAGVDVVPVNPAAQELEGRRAFARVSDVSPPVAGVLLMVPPARAEEAVRDALAAGVRQVWFHKGGGPGAASPAALALCAREGVEVIDGLCPFMALRGAGWFHRLHGWFRYRSLSSAQKLLPPGAPAQT